MGRGSQGAAFQNLLHGAVLWYLLNLYNSLRCCQYIFAKETKIRLFFLLPQPMKNLSCVREETLCVCVCMWEYLEEGKIEFLLTYFPVESLPCSQGSTVFIGYNFGQKKPYFVLSRNGSEGTGSKSFDFSMAHVLCWRMDA